jgi:hypothetical protein
MSEIKVNKLSSRTGNAVTLGTSGDTFTIPSGVTLTNSGTATGFGSDSDISWQAVKTSDFTAASGEGYFVNTTGGAITITLPASPSLGDVVTIRDYAGTFATNNITINRNSSPLGGTASNGTLSTNNSMTTLVYVDGTKGWLTTENEAQGGVIPPAFTSATGGTVSTSGDYKIHTFNSSSNFVVSLAGNSPISPTGGPAIADYLIVAGGAGGGSGYGAAGGGAGGYRESKSPVAGTYTASPLASPTGLTISAQTYPITVGAGGGGGPQGKRGVQGSNSIFSTITSAGGGYGGSYYDPAGQPYTGNAGGPGGSGGGEGGAAGSSGGTGNTPPVSPPQGNNGGSNQNSGNHHASGGGGAGDTGGNGQNNGSNTPKTANGYGGHGGDGVTTAIKGSNGNYAGGGGGGRESNCAPHQGEGGSGGGGGAGLNATAGSNGGANQGGGGGGQGGTALIPSGYGSGGGSGGSGIVIIRYKYQ